ncbi:superoxide dismutase [Cohnella boryungensis]|uniref:superoxide dismutase n=1 Tax=Cohnella boryungensis TaxID=768479 RepID=A0ABV8S7R9_9BACL
MPTVPSMYGRIDPRRLLEELAIWKAQEREHISSVRKAAPVLEPVYDQWLADWEQVLGRTREHVLQLQEASESKASDGDPSSGLYSGLLGTALRQSMELERQLQLFGQHSQALSRLPSSHVVFSYLNRQFEFGRDALNQLHRSGALESDERQPQEEDLPDGYEGPEPADAPLSRPPLQGPALSQEREDPGRPEGTWSNPTGTGNLSMGSPVPIGGHTLPPLPYSYKALEPYIDEKTMRIHHDKHHQAYVNDLNKAEKKLEEARRTGDFELVKHWERELAFNGAGHYLHTLFWDVMSPRGGGKPSGPLLEEINRSFGSYDAFKKQFSEAAAKVEGGGWAILVWSPRSHRLEILTAEKHQNLSQWDVIPLLPLDVWEHAYYLKHQNDRAAYIKDWWNVVNWPYVADRFAKARTIKWTPY